jgi:hypothetical protein
MRSRSRARPAARPWPAAATSPRPATGPAGSVRATRWRRSA